MKSSGSTESDTGSCLVLKSRHLSDLLSFLTGVRFNPFMLETWRFWERRQAQRWCDRHLPGMRSTYGPGRSALPATALRVIENRGNGNLLRDGSGNLCKPLLARKAK
jgi:hypothetical protein